MPTSPAPVRFIAASVLALCAMAEAADFSFAPPVESLLPKGQTPIVIRLADLDGDAKLDAIVTGRNWDGEEGGTARVAILRGVGDGSFVPWREVFVVDGHAEDARIVQLDGDGIADLVVSVSGRTSRVAIFRGQADGTFAPPAYVPIERSPRGLCTVDFDGDGDLDIVSTNYNSGSLSLVRNQGIGFASAGSVRLMRYLGGLAFPQQANDADLDGDRRTDVVTTTLGASRVTVSRGIVGGDGFAPPVDWKPELIGGESPAVIGSSIADYDNDGDADVALPVLLVTQAQKVVTLTNDGSAGFAEKRVHDSLGFYYAWCSAPLDVDGDGRIDLAIGTALTGSVYFLRNETASPTSPIVFVPQFLFIPYGFFVRDMTSGDVDGDGDADVVGIEIAGGTIFTLLNTTGNGVAGADARRTRPPSPPRPAMPVTRDLDEDGSVGAADVALWLESWTAARGADATKGAAR